jgi:hypothetical protein
MTQSGTGHIVFNRRLLVDYPHVDNLSVLEPQIGGEWGDRDIHAVLFCPCFATDVPKRKSLNTSIYHKNMDIFARIGKANGRQKWTRQTQKEADPDKNVVV